MKKGFTLLELIVSIAIIAILLMVIMPMFGSLTAYVNGVVCAFNRKQLYREYVGQVALRGADGMYNEEVFLSQITEDVCPDDGVITWVDDDFHCSVHSAIVQEEEVPYL